MMMMMMMVVVTVMGRREPFTAFKPCGNGSILSCLFLACLEVGKMKQRLGPLYVMVGPIPMIACYIRMSCIFLATRKCCPRVALSGVRGSGLHREAEK